MDRQNKDGESDSRESYGLQISELLKALADMKSPPRIVPRNISTTLSILKNTSITRTRETFRSRAVLPENISRLSVCKFKRRDQRSENLPGPGPVPAPVTAGTSSQEGQLQPRLLTSNPAVLTLLLEKSRMLPSDFEIQEIHPHILGVQAWTRQRSCEPQWTLPQRPTSEWFFEDLVDLQRKLFSGASKKHGVLKHSSGKTTHHHESESSSPLS